MTEVHFLTHATLDRLRQRLLAEEFHGLHFIGHGQLEPESGDGLLLLEDERGLTAPMTGRDLAIQLADRTSLRWVFLNACSTGSSPTRRPFGGLAAALLRTGVPAVVAMQRRVSDLAAVVFSRTVYQRLADGDGIDTAVSEGRLAIHRHLPGSAEWGTPVLFLRSADGVLFRRHATPVLTDTRPPQAKRSGRWWILALTILLIGLVAASKMDFGPSKRSTDEIHRSTQVDPASGAIVVREGNVVSVPELGAHVSVSFDDSMGTSFARLIVSLEGKAKPIKRTFMQADTVDLGEGRSLRIQTIDWQRREVRILPVARGD